MPHTAMHDSNTQKSTSKNMSFRRTQIFIDLGQPVINIPQGDQSLCIDLSMFSLQGVNSRKASLVKNKITLPNLLLH